MAVAPPYLWMLGGSTAALLTGSVVVGGFPADVQFKFRLYSIIAQLILWTTIALVFARWPTNCSHP